MEDNRSIGIFDSGIGGATVLKEILKVLPNENYIYFSDSKYNPYGDKEDSEIIDRCEKITEFFIENNCKAIVIACNTATSKAGNELREKYKDLPIIGIEPAYKMVYDNAYNEETLVMATKATLDGKKFNELLNKYDNGKTELLHCVGLAELIENNDEEKIKEYLKEHLDKYKGKVKNVVLGCTHYPLIKNEIKDVLGNIQFFDGSKSLAKHLKDVLEEKNIIYTGTESGKIKFVDSSKNELKAKRFKEILSKEE
jgi:glutamate racemase